MPLTDLGADELVYYRPELPDPTGFDDFWRRTLAEARSRDGAIKVERVTAQHMLRTVEVEDVRFPGWNGEPVAAWLLRPRDAAGPLPVVITYIGYGGGRGLPTDHLLWSAAGYAQLVVDSRGQGHDTPDRGLGDGTQWVEGFMTRGIDSPDDYYYRRLITDCVRAVDAVAQLPGLDSRRIVVAGGSQGAVWRSPSPVSPRTAWRPRCRTSRSCATSATPPRYAAKARTRRSPSTCAGTHRVEPAFDTLDYFDGVHFARRATAPTLFSVALMDPVCPPSTVYAAFNRYAGADRTMTVWPFGDHGGGLGSNPPVQLDWLRERGLAPEL